MLYPIAERMHDEPARVAYYKKSHLERDNEFTIQVQDIFKPLEPLAAKLHRFLLARYKNHITPILGLCSHRKMTLPSF
jgi:hypothetical protein